MKPTALAIMARELAWNAHKQHREFCEYFRLQNSW